MLKIGGCNMKRLALKWAYALILLAAFPAGSFAATVDVEVRDSFFSPQNVTIDAGDTVRWTQLGSLPHTTTSGSGCASNGTWNSGTLSGGQSFSHTFTSAGSFPYYCVFHCGGGMTGTVTVNAPLMTMPLPTGYQVFLFDPVSEPVVSPDPAQAKPVGIGSLSIGGPELSIRITTPQFSGPANILFAISADIDPNNIYILTQEGGFVTIAEAGLVFWKQNTAGPVDEPLFGDIPISLLPPGQYILYLGVVPASPPPGDLPFYLWETAFIIP